MFPKYFNEEEFKCKGAACCGGSAPMDALLLSRLVSLREKLGEPIFINSGYRCKIHNAHVGGASKSFHTYGKAADIRTGKLDPVSFGKIAKTIFPCVIVYDAWIHVDVREGAYYADKRS